MGLLEDASAKIEGCAGGGVFDDGGGAFDAEVLVVVAGFEDTLGDEEHGCTGFEGLDGRLEGEMSEEAERHGDVSKDTSAFTVAKDGGLAAGVDVGEDAKGKVVTA